MSYPPSEVFREDSTPSPSPSARRSIARPLVPRKVVYVLAGHTVPAETLNTALRWGGAALVGVILLITALIFAAFWAYSTFFVATPTRGMATAGPLAATSGGVQGTGVVEPGPQSTVAPASTTPIIFTVAAGPSRVRTQDVNLRERPGATAPQITILPRGTEVEVLGEAQRVEESTWVRVRAQGREGWMNQRYVTPADEYQPDPRPRARVVGVFPDNLLIRENPGRDARVRGRISEGAEVAVIEVREEGGDSWWRVSIDDLEGWANGAYLQNLP